MHDGKYSQISLPPTRISRFPGKLEIWIKSLAIFGMRSRRGFMTTYAARAYHH